MFSSRNRIIASGFLPVPCPKTSTSKSSCLKISATNFSYSLPFKADDFSVSFPKSINLATLGIK